MVDYDHLDPTDSLVMFRARPNGLYPQTRPGMLTCHLLRHLSCAI